MKMGAVRVCRLCGRTQDEPPRSSLPRRHVVHAARQRDIFRKMAECSLWRRGGEVRQIRPPWPRLPTRP